ncbi:sulfide:quinone oxidoreductase, mitochondrial [Leptidea sinapis]|uniref:sulfide:quinone oxidoreductase, mitochondrial n=1 Tax=Leptidea sinapis TaxID=189913 RepID=UPI00212E1B48|nr:sulfide:quinone oxidoreductase, mitochondrial [Leptidea sinapis]
MNKVLCKFGLESSKLVVSRYLSVSASNKTKYTCKLLVVGGGSGGCTVAAKFSRRLKKGSVIVLEPSSDHYYQPLFTLVGAGVTSVAATRRDAASVLPSNAVWIQDSAKSIKPSQNVVITSRGDEISYEYAVIAAGLKNDYDKIPGLPRALKDSTSGVSTIYAPEYAEKTWSDIRSFEGGEAVFTFPDTPIKCPGAPQKIAYMADAYFNKKNVRSKSTITYNTCLPTIFGVKKYADELMKVVERKKIKVNYRSVLKSIDVDRKEAVFTKSGDQNEQFTLSYKLLHVTPPMSTPAFLHSPEVSDACGFLTVDKFTLRHDRHTNIYGIGDCTNTANSKTAAAIAKQCYVLERNLWADMSGGHGAQRYDGYGACPIVTSYGTCILAEFLYDGVPHETMPYNQAKESKIAYYMKRHLFPFIYWNMMLKGWYHGPEIVRKIINPFGN